MEMTILRLFLFGLLTASCYGHKREPSRYLPTKTTELDPTVVNYVMYHVTDGPPVTLYYERNFEIQSDVVPLVGFPNAARRYPSRMRDSLFETNIPRVLTSLNIEASRTMENVRQEISAAQATPHLYNSAHLASLSGAYSFHSVRSKVVSGRVSELDAGQTPAWRMQPKEASAGITAAYQVGTMDARLDPPCAFAACDDYERDHWLIIEGYDDVAADTTRVSSSSLLMPAPDPSTNADPTPSESNEDVWLDTETFVHTEKTFAVRSFLERDPVHAYISDLGGTTIHTTEVNIDDMLHKPESARTRFSELLPTSVPSPTDPGPQVTPPPADNQLHERGTRHKHCRGLPGWNGHGGRSDCYVSSCMAQYEGNMTLYGVHTYLNDKGIDTTSRFTSTIEGPHWGISMPNMSTTHGWGAHRTVEPWRPECTDRESCRERCAKMVERGFRFGWIIITILLGVTVVALTGVFCCMCCQHRRGADGNDRPDDQAVDRAPRGRRQERGSVFASGTDNATDQPGDVRARNVAGPAEA